MRFLFRLAVLGLAAFGAKTLYERYRPQIQQKIEAAKSKASSATGAQGTGATTGISTSPSGAAGAGGDIVIPASNDVATPTGIGAPGA